MDYVTEPRRLRRRRRPAPLLLLILAAVVVMGLLAAVVLSLRDRRSQPEPEADPHAGQVYVNDGANMVWLTAPPASASGTSARTTPPAGAWTCPTIRAPSTGRR